MLIVSVIAAEISRYSGFDLGGHFQHRDAVAGDTQNASKLAERSEHRVMAVSLERLIRREAATAFVRDSDRTALDSRCGHNLSVKRGRERLTFIGLGKGATAR